MTYADLPQHGGQRQGRPDDGERRDRIVVLHRVEKSGDVQLGRAGDSALTDAGAGVVGQQQLQARPPGLPDLLGVRSDAGPVGGPGTARGRKRAGVVALDGAQLAGDLGGQSIGLAQRRHGGAGRSGGVQQRGTRRHRDRYAVDKYRDCA